MPRDLYMRYYLTAALIIIVDQLSKVYIRTNMRVGQSFSVIGEFFKLTYIKNTGAAFSMLSGMRTLLVILPVIAVVLCIWYLSKHKNMHPLGKFAIWTIMAGGIGNLIDRTFLGFVTDMFDFSIFPPVFNVADIAVTVGCALLVLYVLLEEKLEKTRK